jgi:hypothetical protein
MLYFMPEIPLRTPERSAPGLEVAPERFEQAQQESAKHAEVLPRTAPAATPLPAAPSGEVSVAPVRSLSPLERRVENILAEGLDDFYRSLRPAEQELFRLKGEETAVKISTLLGQFKVRLSEVLSLIRDWLQTIPGLNRYFVEQTAKIKADRVLKLK